ncbi:class I SAM-dependent rRNA methyltransferase [Roseivirga sp. BDSF3-8]|uniref:class I SAM-dependent rRNA methyltransferase n=1 Tax=Roseivirga sp. BDSF3-8 TaxID=3241598 RepID=UPI0035321E79
MDKKIILKKGKDRPVRRFHPWIFSGAIAKITGNPEEGDVLQVTGADGEWLGIAHYQNGSITGRIISFDDAIADKEFFVKRLRSAARLRKEIGLLDAEHTNVFRLVHGEGDGLPGLIIDYYNGTAVVQCHSIGMYRSSELIAESLKEALGDRLKAVYNKSGETLPKKSPVSPEDGYLWGASDTNEVLEYGNRFLIDWEKGQKTGFFIDQRENRRLLSTFSKGKSVINTFCYTGGFSVYALKAGATKVHSVDSSARALELTDKNIALNFPGESSHESVNADVVKYIREVDTGFDVVILDPPAFAKHINVRHNAVQGYKRLNAEAIRRMKSGSVLFTFSCSQVVDRQLFSNTIAAAAIEAGRKVRILHNLSQPADHPVNIFHPESEYLKGLVLYIED